jgi:hypothetical protein
MKHFTLLLILSIFFSCSNTKSVSFKNYIDTKDKSIAYQQKKTYNLKSIDIYASNEFDGARLNDFYKINDSTAVAYITPENEPINNSPYYAFKIWSKKPKTFYIQFKYPKKYKHRYHPKISYDEKSFTEIDSSNIFTKKETTTIKLNLTQKPQIVSSQKIEDYKNVINWSQNFTSKNNNAALDIYSKSNLGKELPVIKINNGKTTNKDIIVLFTRQHPPETTGYYAFQDFIKTLTTNTELTKTFFDNYQVLAFPILNPDGVDLGHWRHNVNGIDLNRDWSKYNQKEIKNTVKFINKYAKKNKSKVIIGLDFHSTWYDIFYTNTERKSTTLPHFINDWFNKIEENYDGYKVKEAAGNSLKPVSKGWFLKAHSAVGITFEIGDTTPKDKINEISKIAAIQMMKILTKIKKKTT